VTWTIVVPLKSLPAAKSRLVGASPDPQAHWALVEAIRADTLAVAQTVGRVLIVADREPSQPMPWPILIQRATGLNAALSEAAAHSTTRWPQDGVVALVGDLPALHADELSAALDRGEQYERSYVCDASGLGTTLLAARPGTALLPAFGPGSAERHAAIAQLLPAGPGLRLDVDTAEDLDAARELGVGPATKAVLGW
jgi:2-phospho-L-lactate guanylyltransferase